MNILFSLMRTLFAYILFLIHVTVMSQIVQFDFNNYALKNITNNKSIYLFDDYRLNDSLIPYKSLLMDGHFDLYAIHSLSSETFSSKIENWYWPNEPHIELKKGFEKGRPKTTINIYPFISVNGQRKKIVTLKLKLNPSKNSSLPFKTTEEIINSVLSSGKWFKFKIPKSGVYEITYQQLKELNILSQPIAHTQLAIFSNTSEMLPFIIGSKRMEDLKEIPLQFRNLSSNTFNEFSSMIFYANADGNVKKDSSDNFIKKEINLYSDTNFIFLNIDATSNKVVNNENTLPEETTIYDCEHYFHHEIEQTNFIRSGRDWIGDPFTKNPIELSFPISPPLSNKDLKVKYRVCSRSSQLLDNKISVLLEKDTISVAKMNKVSSVYYNDYVKFSTKEVTLPQYEFNDDSVNLKLYYHQESNPLAWLDYLTVNYVERISTKHNKRTISLFTPTDLNTKIHVKSDLNNIDVWDISNLFNVSSIPTINDDSGFTFVSLIDTVKKFIIVENKNYPSPDFVSHVPNQNLHNSSPSNYIIITTPEFKLEAQRLIDLHTRRDQLSGQLFFVEEIFNEFSCGRPEASGIRNFIQLLYKKGNETADSLQYVLLMGEGSYDPKNRITNNTNPIPTFQSINSIKLTSSYVTDDFYGLLDQGEGEYLNGDLLDIAVGRLPVENENQAKLIIDKIYEYYDEYQFSELIKEKEQTLLSSKGSWRNDILFIADDEDFNEHMRQSNSLSQRVDSTIRNFNAKKIFLDAYPQEASSLGKISPIANEKLIQQLHNGALIANYTGHGGERGWTSERIFLLKDISDMKNRNKLPLFMTATCEFSRFDNPENVSAGERLLLQPEGGAIALFTTVRLVFSIPNFRLNETFYKVLDASIKDGKITIGDLFRKTKVENNGGVNDRNFTLLGDPAIKLAVPLYKVQLDSLVNSENNDSIKALSSPEIFGHIENLFGSTVNEFNGWIDITLFDKEKEITTLGDDQTAGPFTYASQEDILFKGKAFVENGRFKSQIYIPKDTRQNYGFARFSFYAVDSILGDASGNNESIVIGGTAKNASIDRNGPEINIHLDDSLFAFGDKVSSSPIFIADLFDSSGINIIPNDVGKDITLIIDERSDLNFLLNQYYQPSKSTYQKGEIIFPLEELDEGRHSLVFKVFDNQNNSSKAYTEFIIENNPQLALTNVLNYPNPFTTSTGFYFEHNQTNDVLDITIEIYTISGKLIKTISDSFDATSTRIGPVQWDGLDDFGSPIGRGVYVYKVRVINANGDKEEVIEKLVLLR